MEGIKEEAIHHTALKLAEEIKNLSIYKSFYSDVQVRAWLYYVPTTKLEHTQYYRNFWKIHMIHIILVYKRVC